MPRIGSASRSARRISPGAHGATCSTGSRPLATKRLIVVSLTRNSVAAPPQAQNLRIGHRAGWPPDVMVAPRRRHALLAPPPPLAGPSSEPIQHAGDLIIAIALRHPPDQLHILDRRQR